MLTRITIGDIVKSLFYQREAQSMFKTRLYQMYDLTAEAVAGPIISEKKDGPAIRAFHTVLGDKRTSPGQYPEQFQLRFLGTQDEETGFIDGIVGANIIATGQAWLESQQLQAAPDGELALSR